MSVTTVTAIDFEFALPRNRDLGHLGLYSRDG